MSAVDGVGICEVSRLGEANLDAPSWDRRECLVYSCGFKDEVFEAEEERADFSEEVESGYERLQGAASLVGHLAGARGIGKVWSMAVYPNILGQGTFRKTGTLTLRECPDRRTKNTA